MKKTTWILSIIFTTLILSSFKELDYHTEIPHAQTEKKTHTPDVNNWWRMQSRIMLEFEMAH